MVKLVADEKEKNLWELEDTSIRADIGYYLAATGKQLPELAQLMGISKGTLYSRYKHPGDFSLDELRRLYGIMKRILAKYRAA